jgi:mannose-6-phosphate isomerase-like protein (cupin superfamily)
MKNIMSFSIFEEKKENVEREKEDNNSNKEDNEKKNNEDSKDSEVKKTFGGFKSDIEKDTIENNNFRKVLYTGKNLQLVLMSLKPDEEIGEEIHNDNDQFFRFENGKGKVIIDGNRYKVKNGDAVIVPAGAKHNVINTGKDELKLYTIYAPPHHKDGILRATKQDAESNKEEFDGKTTE